jgi:hypothetical protein
MAGFRRAKAEQAALKLGLYGPAGSGKTFTSLLLAEGLAQLAQKRVAFIDTEHGTDFYCQHVASRHVHPEAFDFDAIYTRSLTEMLAEVKKLNPDEYAVIVLDSISHVWEAAMAAYAGKVTSVGSIPMYAWGKIKKPYKDLMSLLLSTPVHMIICGRQKTIYTEDEETDELKASGVTMRAEGETPYEPHILIRMESVRPKKVMEVAQIVAYVEKDRTGVLAGRSYINPTFDALCKPLLGLLGTKQAQVDTMDEVANKDAEALAIEEQQRAVDSANLAREFKAKFALAKDAKELKKLANEITPQVRARMIPSDLTQTREAWATREKELVAVPAATEGAA